VCDLDSTGEPSILRYTVLPEDELLQYQKVKKTSDESVKNHGFPMSL
jgi:hypothetical protein